MSFTFIYNVTTTTTGDQLTKDDLTAQINGSIQQFTTSNSFETGSLRVYYNGVRQVESETFSETTSTTFTTTFLTIPGDYLTIDYTPN